MFHSSKSSISGELISLRVLVQRVQREQNLGALKFLQQKYKSINLRRQLRHMPFIAHDPGNVGIEQSSKAPLIAQ